MSNKFGGLAAVAAETFKVEIVDTLTEEVIRDKNGKPCFIEIYAADSEIGLKFDKEKRAVYRRKAMKSRSGSVEADDALEENIAKCAALTKSWYLVDPISNEHMDVPCTPENAQELYSIPGMSWLFVQPWTEANKAANFIKRSSKSLSPSPSTASVSGASATTAQPKASI